MNPATNTSINTSVETEGRKLSRVIPITIGDQLCYPKFKCIHLEFPGEEQLQKDILIHLLDCANNFDASDEELYSEFSALIKTASESFGNRST